MVSTEVLSSTTIVNIDNNNNNKYLRTKSTY